MAVNIAADSSNSDISVQLSSLQFSPSEEPWHEAQNDMDGTLRSTDSNEPARTEGRCYFFVIRREIRDMIYEYVLSEPDGLYCRYTDKEPCLFKMYASLHKADAPDVAAAKKAANMATVEANNAIKATYDAYDAVEEHATEVTAEAFHKAAEVTGAVFGKARAADKAYKAASNALEALDSNQLKYVCRQLYKETTGLGLKFNDLHFVETPSMDMPALHQFHKFLKKCTDKKKQWLKVVKLEQTQEVLQQQAKVMRQHDTEEVEMEEWAPSKRLRDFGRLHPETTVWVSIPTRYSDGDGDGQAGIWMFVEAATLSIAIRGKTYGHVFRHDRKMSEWLSPEAAMKWKPWEETPETTNVPNVRYTLPHLDQLLGEDFQRAWRSRAKTAGVQEEQIEKLVEGVVSVVKDWIKNGL